MIQVRTHVNKAIEKQRAQGLIGSPLQAKVILYVKGELYEDLTRLEDELRFVLITSQTTLLPITEKEDAESTEMEDLWVKVIPTADEKCARCWHHRPDVNQTVEYPGLCGRCVSNVSENNTGEERHYA